MPGFFGVGKKKKSSEGKDKRVLLLGLDGAGTTVTLYRWKLGEAPTTIPTIGFNVETVPTRGRDLTIWDVGGHCGGGSTNSGVGVASSLGW